MQSSESVYLWFGYIERMDNDRIAKGAHVGVCVGSRLVGELRER